MMSPYEWVSSILGILGFFLAAYVGCVQWLQHRKQAGWLRLELEESLGARNSSGPDLLLEVELLVTNTGQQALTSRSVWARTGQPARRRALLAFAPGEQVLQAGHSCSFVLKAGALGLPKLRGISVETADARVWRLPRSKIRDLNRHYRLS